jgi:hypothetical protein
LGRSSSEQAETAAERRVRMVKVKRSISGELVESWMDVGREEEGHHLPRFGRRSRASGSEAASPRKIASVHAVNLALNFHYYWNQLCTPADRSSISYPNQLNDGLSSKKKQEGKNRRAEAGDKGCQLNNKSERKHHERAFLESGGSSQEVGAVKTLTRVGGGCRLTAAEVDKGLG